MANKSKKKKLWILLILIPLVLVIGTFAGIALPLIISYNNNAYEEVDIVERTDEYVVPEQDSQPDEWANVTLKEEDIGRDITTGETLPNNVNQGGSNGPVGDGLDRNASFGRTENVKSVYGKTPIYKVEKKDPKQNNLRIR